jgi:chorismate mutase
MDGIDPRLKLDRLRAQIDSIDARLWSLLDIRAQLAARAWSLRGGTLAKRDEDREDEIVGRALARASRLSVSKIDHELVAEVYKAIIEACATHAKSVAMREGRPRPG